MTFVQVIDNGSVVKVDRQVLSEVPSDLAGLLEPVPDLDVRVKLLSRPQILQRFAALALGSEVRVFWNRSQSELAEAELRFRGPLTRGSSAVYFGVQLKASLSVTSEQYTANKILYINRIHSFEKQNCDVKD